MVSKKDLIFRMDDLCEEINSLQFRMLALERKLLTKDLKQAPKRGRGRPRKSEDKDGKKK